MSPTSPPPHLDSLNPTAAMPLGEIEAHGSLLSNLPQATIGDTPAPITLSRPNRLIVRIPEGAISGDLIIRRGTAHSNGMPVSVAVPMAENLHPVANPAVDADGNVYTTFSGSRGQSVPVGVFRISRDFQMRPFARDIINPTGLAFDRENNLFVSSRNDGTIFRITPTGSISTYAEGMGIATGIAFDSSGNLFVGDRSGTIFKISPTRETFVFATLEPSVAAYHLAFNSQGTLLVAGPTTSSNEDIHAIDPDGNITPYFHGLGRPQGMAFDVAGNLYIAASLHGRRGIVRITPQREATLAIAGSGLVGIAFLEDGCAALATNSALFHIALNIEGRPLM